MTLPLDPLRVLAVAADDAHHAPIRALLKGAQIDHVVTGDEAHHAVAANRYDVIMVDREIGPHGVDGLDLATELVGTPAPVIVLAHRQDRAADARAAEAGIADFLHLAGLSTDRLEHAIRYALKHQQAVNALKAIQERDALALEGTNDGVWDWDVAGDRVDYSARWKAMLGYRESEIGETRGEWLGRIHADDRAPFTQAMDAFLQGAAAHFDFEHRVQHRDGGYRWLCARATAVRDHLNRATRVVGTTTDTTNRRESERRLQHDALHDALTGLPNRVLFVDRLDQSIRRAQRRHPATCAAVLFLDLDRFKVINDSLGHACGDQLLQKVARRLEAALRPNDTVARLSGDEFTLLLDDVSDPREATVIAERVLQSLKLPFVIDNRELFIDSSIGIALATAKSAPQQVMRDADVAMYRAKADGKGRHAVFDAAMHQQVMRRLDLEGDLRRAIETRALEVVYQPITQAATGRVVGFEASCRWPNGEPAEVLAMADETGLSIPLGRQILETACAQLAQWRLLPRGAGLTIGVNVSARQLGEPGYVDMLDEILLQTHLDPRALRLEVSEHDLSRGRADDATRRVLDQAFEHLSVRTHIDDFGTGASPLRLLHRFPGDAIKVSRALVAGIGHDAGAFEIVRAVVGLAHNLGLEVIADGVEKREQLDYLKVLGCEFAQGFHISAPLSAEEARAMLESGVLAQ
ncbi:EAL domain-containing protein [Solirubrobacter taibaiensis]|nr:EAL domain-containing protein [Solirubrobacter taibaiensis]